MFFNYSKIAPNKKSWGPAIRKHDSRGDDDPDYLTK